jgi:HrpA-like RNA helicase
MTSKISYTESSDDLPVCLLKDELLEAIKAFSILLVVGETGKLRIALSSS